MKKSGTARSSITANATTVSSPGMSKNQRRRGAAARRHDGDVDLAPAKMGNE